MKDWSKLKVVALKAELKKRGLPQAGLKQELVDRLEAADAAPSPAPSAPANDSLPSPEPTADLPEESATVPATAPSAPVKSAQPDSREPQPSKPGLLPASPSAEPKAPTPAASVKAPSPPPEAPFSAEPSIANSPSHETAALNNGLLDQKRAEMSSTPVSVVVEGDMPTAAAPVEVGIDAQKRKRRSGSPPPSEELASRKRAKQDDAEHHEEAQLPDAALEPSPSHLLLLNQDASGSNEHDAPARGAAEPDLMEYERDVEPSTHSATSALYVKNFMRPLRPEMVQEHLLSLVSPAGTTASPDDILTFYLDPIRTHAFAIFKSVAAASRVRAALHRRVWPDEANRKELWVDFVPPERVPEWIKIEDSRGSGRGSGGARWEVVYHRDENGNVISELDSGGGRADRPPPFTGQPPLDSRRERGPPSPAKNINPIPLGPRALRGVEGAPLAPRGNARGGGWLGQVRQTHSHPVVSYQPVPDDLVQRRIGNMRSFYTADRHRKLGKEINRYTFENQDSFVDRGKEVFVGIRPPHRERERRLQMQGGHGSGSGGGFGAPRGPGYGPPPRRRGGGPPFRPRSDRYLPGGGGGGYGGRELEGRPRFDDDGYSSRRGDDRGPPRHDDRDRRDDFRDSRDRRYY